MRLIIFIYDNVLTMFYFSFLPLPPDTPKVSLSENCHGLVKIDGIEVCNSFWNMEMSHMVCQEQNCSNAITPTKTIGAKSNADYYHSYHFHHELGQCRRVTGMCGPGKELVSVNCIGKTKTHLHFVQ